jgi:hypothetical protein
MLTANCPSHDDDQRCCAAAAAAAAVLSEHAWQRQLLLRLQLHDGAALCSVDRAALQALCCCLGAHLGRFLEGGLNEVLDEPQLRGRMEGKRLCQ